MAEEDRKDNELPDPLKDWSTASGNLTVLNAIILQDELQIRLLRIEIAKATAELNGAMKTRVAPVGSAYRDVTIGVAIEKIAHLGGMLNEIEDLRGRPLTKTSQVASDGQVRFEGTYEQFATWVKDVFWPEKDAE